MFKLKKGAQACENKTVRLPIEMIDEVQKLANENNLSFNSVIQQCVQYALDNMKED
jgi:hypothetical protein